MGVLPAPVRPAPREMAPATLGSLAGGNSWVVVSSARCRVVRAPGAATGAGWFGARIQTARSPSVDEQSESRSPDRELIEEIYGMVARRADYAVAPLITRCNELERRVADLERLVSDLMSAGSDE